ncbi:right-handed parallel beta-helix repeat-containing protein [Coraliomargarita algicola]|uniref:Right-handed parallel beta-helix repeat-containing protein n=1 Tax=Coraliomargarita algicola TaxID=3092156 RepID=A0ABZ0RK70_9BACT|nr:right-handed parallel beta-helix repeat-containing protein [Coraliomargarita sp. J2-16]WPJ95180.1 right-handed parallel beta-helix repeat-containing protein [Coraliomargarita sp. J2-16]
MKKLPPYLPFFFAAFILMLCNLGHSNELLLNPDFEEGMLHWSGASLEETAVYSGVNAARLDQMTYWISAMQQVDCEPGQVIFFGGYVKSEGLVQGNAGIRLVFYDANDQFISDIDTAQVTGTTAYALLEASEGELVPPGADYAKFQLYVSQSATPQGSVYFDALYCDVFSHKALVVNSNGGFEDGYNGWAKGNASLATGSDAFEGGYASSIEHGSFWKKTWYEFACDSSQEYALSFAFATDAATSNGKVEMRYFDSSDALLQIDELVSLTGTNPYALYYLDGLTPPVNVSYARFYFATTQPGTGTSYLDDVLITTDPSGLVSSDLIEQDLVNLLPDSGFELGVSDWNGGVQVESGTVGAGQQAGRFSGKSFFKSYHHDLVSATAGKAYSIRFDAAITDVAVSPSVFFEFIAADQSTVLQAVDTQTHFTGTAPYRSFVSPYYLAPAGTNYIKLRVTFPKDNDGAYFYMDDVQLLESQNLPVRLVPTYEAISVYATRATPVTDEVAHVYYREAGEGTWLEGLELVYDASRSEYRGSVIGLQEGTDYEIQVVLEANGSVLEEAGSTVSTWQADPVIAQTIALSSLYSSGQLLIENMHGEPDGWIRITGTESGDVDGGYADDVALLIRNSSYLIFEDIEVVGGRRHAVEVTMSEHIRLLNCEMSGWGRMPNYTDGIYFYETEAELNSGNEDLSINKDAGVHLNVCSQVTIERCYMHDPRPRANNWEGRNHPRGPTAVLVQNIAGVNDLIMKGNHVVRWNDLIGSDEIRWNDVIEGENNKSDFGSFYRDSDVYGNMLTFGNDDATEMDGGQMNTRYYNNRLENCYVGLSLAPCRVGPSYVYKNVMFNLGDDRGSCFSIVKLGGGDTHSKGKSYFFNNTLYSIGNGITGVGFGSDSNKGMFLGMSRNNIIQCLSTRLDYNRTIKDSEKNPWNSFDYDNLSSNGLAVANVEYAAGQEPNGILDNAPTFVNAATGDFRLQAGSAGIDDGLGILNFADQFAGAAPDQGAIEHGGSSLIPPRPIAVSADQYLVELLGEANGATTPVDVIVSSGALSGSLSYTVKMNDSVSWLSVSPSVGTLNANSSQTFTLTLQTAGLSAGDRLKATLLVKFENGFSIPITVNANIN